MYEKKMSLKEFNDEQLCSEEPVCTKAVEQPHLELANTFALHVMETYNPEEINEIIRYIYQTFVDQRKLDIQKIENEHKYLSMSLQELQR